MNRSPDHVLHDVVTHPSPRPQIYLDRLNLDKAVLFVQAVPCWRGF